MTSRRALLTTTGLGLTAALAACASITPAAVQTQLQTDTAALAAALQTIPALLAQAGVTVDAATQAQIAKVLADINANAAAIAATVTAPPTNVTTIVSDINLVASLVTPFFPMAGVVVPIVDAALSIGSTLLGEAGIALASAAPLPTPKYSPAAARLILAGAAAQ